MIAYSRDLKDPVVLEMYRKKGYLYVRQAHRPYNSILRKPTIGCLIEFTFFKGIGCHLIDSPKARKLIRRSYYF